MHPGDQPGTGDPAAPDRAPETPTRCPMPDLPLKVLLLRLSIWSMVVRSGAGREVPAWTRSVAMAQYLLSVHTGSQTDTAGDVESVQSTAAEEYQQVLALEEDMKAAGAWLFSGRLTDADVATVVRVSAAGDAMT